MTSTSARNALEALRSSTTEAECAIILAEFDTHDAAHVANVALLANIHALSAPEPVAPLPAPLAPVNFRAGEFNGPIGALRTYGGGESPLSVQFGWDAPADGAQFRLDYRGNPGNPHGPQEWTEVPIAGFPGPDGERATLAIVQPAGSVILLRLIAFLNGQDSAPALLAYVVPAVPAE